MSDINSKEYLENVIKNAPEGATHFDNAVSYYKSSGINNSWGIWKGVWCVSVGCNTMRMPPSMRQIQDAKSQLDMIYELEKLQTENAELKNQGKWISVDDFEAHLSDNDFCFVYFPCGAIKKCHLNDYRTYSGKGVYWQDMSGDDLPMLNTKFIKIEIPTPPEGE